MTPAALPLDPPSIESALCLIPILYLPDPSLLTGRSLVVGYGTQPADGRRDGPVHIGRTDAAQRSVSAAVSELDEERIAALRRAFPNGLASFDLIAVEDASLDTCFSLLLFHSRVTGRPLALEPAALTRWLDYVGAYEQGVLLGHDDLDESIATLVASLSHHHLAPVMPGQGLRRGANAHPAVRRCASLLLEVFPATPDPAAGGLPRCELLAEARALLKVEYQQYLHSLKTATTCVLLLPVRHGDGEPPADGVCDPHPRRILVDALFLEDHYLPGSLKAFARRDAVHSWTRRGFGLLGVYRSQAKGTGYDMTLSVDPQQGVHLAPLWSELERLEELAWGNQRPRHSPRRIASYVRNGVLAAEAPNQPWWDENGTYTLLGAPRAVVVEGRDVPGSRLDWYGDVLPAIWRLFHPAGASVREVDTVSSSGGRRFTLVRWEGAGATTMTPTLEAYLASLSMHAHRAASPLDLPRPADYEARAVPGGQLLVHRDGVTLFDDWTSIPLDAERYRATAMALAALGEAHAAHDREAALHGVTATLHMIASQKAPMGVATLVQIERQLLSDRTRLLQLESEDERAVEALTPQQLQWRAILVDRWGIRADRSRTSKMLEELADTARDLHEQANSRLHYWVAVVVAITGTILTGKELIGAAVDVSTRNPFEWSLDLAKANELLKDPVREAELRQDAARAAIGEHAAMFFMVTVLVVGLSVAIWIYRKGKIVK